MDKRYRNQESEFGLMKILVTGAKGMLGQDLCPLLEQHHNSVIETDITDLDITNFNQVEYVIKFYKPELIIHCAAYTNVDKAEKDPKTAFKINATGTENLAKICAEYSIPIVYISTDYVFDGEASIPYKPTDKRTPLGVYGESKAKGEEAIEKYCKKYYIVRTSWLYGHKGKNFIETIIALTQKMPELKVVDDQIGCPTWTMDLVKGILDLIENQKPYGIYHICGGGQTSWYGFAKEALNFCKIKT
ncbi:MAG: dTDP-4-dehydrorhamnose reductase, partial [Candidatus Gastranaerophilales bacterium]|nr:dTDP-4-dehydrorhamnose reductase [Candidatus Gastranaerophilales bacterium]